NGLVFIYNSPLNSLNIRDLSMTTGSASGTALYLQQSSSLGNFSNSSISNIMFRGDNGPANSNYWGNAIYINAVSGVNITNISVCGSGTAQGNGIDLEGFTTTSCSAPGGACGIVYNISNSNFFLRTLDCSMDPTFKA